jgi:hypothetical protein
MPHVRLWIGQLQTATALAVVGHRDLTVEALYPTTGTTVGEILDITHRELRMKKLFPPRLVQPPHRLLKVVRLMYPYYLLQRGLEEPLVTLVVTRHGQPLQHQDVLRLHLMRHMHHMHRPRDPETDMHTVLQLMIFIVYRVIGIAAMSRSVTSGVRRSIIWPHYRQSSTAEDYYPWHLIFRLKRDL